MAHQDALQISSLEPRYFLNDRDQIRYKKRPELDFLFHINKNERINEIQRERMNGMSESGPMDAASNPIMRRLTYTTRMYPQNS